MTEIRFVRIDRPTTFVSTEELRAAISTSDLTPGGTAQITAATPSPGGEVSNNVAFPVGGSRHQ